MEKPKIFSCVIINQDDEYTKKIMFLFLSKKNKKEIYIEQKKLYDIKIDKEDLKKYVIHITNPSYYSYAENFIIHPLSSVFFKLNDAANRIVDYIYKAESSSVSEIIGLYKGIDEDDILNFIILLIQLDLCYLDSDEIVVWDQYSKENKMNFQLKELDCLFINTSEWHTPLHYNVLPKKGEFHLGLLYMATVLKKEGYRTGVLDFGVIPEINFFEIKSILQQTKPKMIGLTARSSNLKTVLDLAKFIKKIDKKISVILGGIEATSSSENILRKYGQIDIVCNNEGEETIKELAGNIINHKNYKNITGISFKNDDDSIQKNICRETISDLDSFPFPDYSLILLPENLKLKDFIKNPTIITSRGCPYHCKFCCSTKYWGGKVRYRSVDNIISEIVDLKNKYDIQSFSFCDDLFTFSKKRVMEFCSKLSKLNFNLTWGCSSRVNYIDDDIIKAMKNAGCDEIFIGIESLDDEVLKLSNKNTNRKTIEKAIKIMRENDIAITAGIILGLPKQRRKDIEDLYNLFEENKKFIKRDNPSILQLFKNTDFYEFENYEINGFAPPEHSYFSSSETKTILPKERNITEEYTKLIIPFSIKRRKMMFWYQIPEPKAVCLK
jgi:radical SAM superfamily enzyme YgiQ (UPF0313 family)